jgi:hypothetical protein
MVYERRGSGESIESTQNGQRAYLNIRPLHACTARTHWERHQVLVCSTFFFLDFSFLEFAGLDFALLGLAWLGLAWLGLAWLDVDKIN